MYLDSLSFLEDERDGWRAYEALADLTDEQLDREIDGVHGWTARDLIAQLMNCDHPKDCEAVQVERLCFAAEQRLLLRGLCVPEEPLARSSRLLVII